MSNIVDDFSFTMWYNSIMQECVEAIVGSSPAVAFVVERRCRCRANPNDPVPAKVARISVMDSTVRNIVWKNAASMTSTSAVRTSIKNTAMRGDVSVTGTLRHILSAKCVSKQDG